MTEKLSECCLAETQIHSMCYDWPEDKKIIRCSKCGLPCTIAKPEETPTSQQPENALLKALNTIDKLPVGKFVESKSAASPDRPDSDRLALREKIAIHLWAYPVKHSWLTFEDAKTFSEGSKLWVKECYEEADYILDLTASLKDGEIAELKTKLHYSEIQRNGLKKAIKRLKERNVK